MVSEYQFSRGSINITPTPLMLRYMYFVSHVVIRVCIHAKTTSYHIPLNSDFIVITMYTFDGAETS